MEQDCKNWPHHRRLALARFFSTSLSAAVLTILCYFMNTCGATPSITTYSEVHWLSIQWPLIPAATASE